MKRLLKLSCYTLLLLCFLNTCVYHRMTHMFGDELEWVSNREEGEVMYFKSQNDIIDTLTILEVSIHNYFDPINWGYFNTCNKEYIAHADVRYGFKNRRDGGIMEIRKMFNGKPICFSSVLLESNWLDDVPLKISKLTINGVTFNDIMLFEDTADNKDASNPIVSYAWSKRYGLVQYMFQDGTTFSRICINKP